MSIRDVPIKAIIWQNWTVLSSWDIGLILGRVNPERIGSQRGDSIKGGSMDQLRITILLLIVFLLSGCATQLQRPEKRSGIREQIQEQRDESDPLPTFSYRPG